MTVVKINDAFQIGAVPYRIVYNDRILQKLEKRAHVSISEQVVLLQSKNSNELRTVELCHEGLHVIADALGTDIEEADVIGIGNLLAQFLTSLGIELDFSNVKEEKAK